MRASELSLFASLAMALCLSIGATVAGTPSNYEIVSASGIGTQNPTCPGSKKAIGGGAMVPSFNFIHESRPETTGTGWRATAQNNVFLIAYAICADVDPSYEIVSSSGGGTQSPACPGSKKALGGGARVPSFNFIHESRPETTGAGWRATAQGNVLVVADAICAEVDSTYEIVSSSGGGTQSPPCPSGKSIVGGGESVPSFSFIHESRPETSGTGWRATAQGNVFIVAYAICSIVGSGSGRVDGLTMEKRVDGDLGLSWNPSCVTGDDDYAIYSGTIGGTFSDHVPVVCTTLGTTTGVVPSPSGSAYFLVVPLRTGAQEGSYGLQTSGERAPGTSQCLTQRIAPCS